SCTANADVTASLGSCEHVCCACWDGPSAPLLGGDEVVPPPVGGGLDVLSAGLPASAEPCTVFAQATAPVHSVAATASVTPVTLILLVTRILVEPRVRT